MIKTATVLRKINHCLTLLFVIAGVGLTISFSLSKLLEATYNILPAQCLHTVDSTWW